VDPNAGPTPWDWAGILGSGSRELLKEIAPVTCRDFADFLLDYVEGALPTDTRRRFDEHMAICPDCVHYLQHYTETVKAGRLAMVDDLPEDVPEELVSAILRARDGAGDQS
jgi:anti-sigma factor RsiW